MNQSQPLEISMTDPTDRIHRYFQLAAAGDMDAYLAQFSTDAVAEDEGHEYRGVDAIRSWRGEVVSVAYTTRTIERDGDEHVARTEVAGDFPGSPVTLAFHFTFTADGQISRLAIQA
jgi:ketosteroid isomerase-like protein